MKPYPAYKDSGIEWIGKVPEHWDVVQIKRLSQVKRGASPRPIEDPKYFDDEGEFCWVRIADVSSSDRYLESTTQTLSELGASLSVKRYPGDLFLSIAGTVGKPIITKIKCCIHDGFVWFPNLKINPEYLYYIFSAGEAYKGLGKWGTQLNLNTETVGSIPLPFPPEEVEFERIINFLDYKTSQIDTLIEKKQKQIELLKEERTAIINQAVTKGLNPDVPMKDSGIEWLGEVPEHWEIKPLKYITKINDSVLPENTDKNYIIQYIDIGNVGQGYLINPPTEMIFRDAPSRARRILKRRDIIISTVRTYLKAIAYIDFENTNLVASTGFAVISATDNIDSKYLYYMLSSQKFIDTVASYSVGVSYPAIASTQISSIPVCYPPSLKEQKEFVKFIENDTLQIANIITIIQNQITLLQEYRTALISNAVTGKIDVRDYHGNST